LEGFTLKQVAEDAGVSKQMIYTLFGVKADLVKAVYDRAVEQMVEQLKAVTASGPIDRLHQYAVAYREFVREHEALFDLLYSLDLAKSFKERDKEIVKRNEIFDYYDEAIRAAIEEGYIDAEVDVESLTDSLWAAANGCIRLEIVGYYEDENEAEQHYLETLSGLLEGYEPG
jgi:AcrR family transcriptional regulator